MVIISPNQPKYDGLIATCNSFLGTRGVYDVSMASGELCYFPPDNVRPFDGCEFESTSVEPRDNAYYNATHERAEAELELSSIIDKDSIILNVNHAQMSQGGRAANARSSSSRSHELGTRASKVASE